MKTTDRIRIACFSSSHSWFARNRWGIVELLASDADVQHRHLFNSGRRLQPSFCLLPWAVNRSFRHALIYV